MTIAGRYELENTLGSQNEAYQAKFTIWKRYIRKLVLHVYLILCLDASKKVHWETPSDAL